MASPSPAPSLAPSGQPTIRYSSSYRCLTVSETLAAARPLAAGVGVTRVTEITRLDRLGVPVAVSVRPGALPGSLCVSAGKGLSRVEATVGAYMEAIELAFAEFGRSSVVEVVTATARDVLDGRTRPEAILDLCPVAGARIPLDRPMTCVAAQDLLGGAEVLVPAEVVFLPAPAGTGPPFFGANSNGLCSGNTALEATVHGLGEVMERHVHSLQLGRDTSRRLVAGSVPPSVGALWQIVADAGLTLLVRWQPNDFGIPFFSALLADTDRCHPGFLNSGFGCHPDAEVALVRAVTEAVQSRACYIHGGREDLRDYYRLFEGWSEARRRRHVETVVTRWGSGDHPVAFDDVTGPVVRGTLDDAYDALRHGLGRVGMDRVLRVAYTPPSLPLQVVRVIVPGCEFAFEGRTRRVGRRLHEWARGR